MMKERSYINKSLIKASMGVNSPLKAAARRTSFQTSARKFENYKLRPQSPIYKSAPKLCACAIHHACMNLGLDFLLIISSVCIQFVAAKVFEFEL